MYKIYSVGSNERSDLYEPWQRHKQLETLEMNEAWPDIYDEGCIHQFQPGPIRKIQYQQQKHQV